MKLALCLVVASLLCAAPASADYPPISPSSDSFSFERRALKMADALWGPVPCGRLSVSWEMRPEGEEGTEWAWVGECVIHLDADSIELRYWEPFCTAVLHAAGHIIGREHTEGGLMAPGALFSIMEFQPSERQRRAATTSLPQWVTSVTGGNWRCDHAGRPWLRRMAG